MNKKQIATLINLVIIFTLGAFAVYFNDTEQKLNQLLEDEKDLPQMFERSFSSYSLEDMKPKPAHPRNYDFVRKYIGTTFDPTGRLYDKVKTEVIDERITMGAVALIIICLGLLSKVVLKKFIN